MRLLNDAINCVIGYTQSLCVPRDEKVYSNLVDFAAC